MATAQKKILPLAARTSSGHGDAFDISRDRHFVLHVNVTAVSGTSPTLTVSVQDSPDEDDSHFAEVRKIEPDITTTGAYRVEVGNLMSKYCRIAWAIGGTDPSFTFDATLSFNPL